MNTGGIEPSLQRTSKFTSHYHYPQRSQHPAGHSQCLPPLLLRRRARRGHRRRRHSRRDRSWRGRLPRLCRCRRGRRGGGAALGRLDAAAAQVLAHRLVEGTLVQRLGPLEDRRRQRRLLQPQLVGGVAAHGLEHAGSILVLRWVVENVGDAQVEDGLRKVVRRQRRARLQEGRELFASLHHDDRTLLAGQQGEDLVVHARGGANLADLRRQGLHLLVKLGGASHHPLETGELPVVRGLDDRPELLDGISSGRCRYRATAALPLPCHCHYRATATTVPLPLPCHGAPRPQLPRRYHYRRPVPLPLPAN
eukprot:15472960-Alexandrium_andersonii.AAC.2